MEKLVKSFIKTLTVFACICMSACTKPISKTYTITWQNYDGTTLETDTVEQNQVPTYDGAKPTRNSTAEFNYTFDGWTPEVDKATRNQIYTAKFIENKNVYTITWDVEGNKTTESYNYGDTPSWKGADPIKPTTAEFTYQFTGWSPTIEKVTGDKTYTAQFEPTKNTYVITWDVEGVKTTESYNYGDTPSWKGANPIKSSDAQHTYEFNGWSPTIEKVIGDKTYTAQFGSTLTAAYVSFDLNGGTTQSDSSNKYMSSIVAENFFFDVKKDNYNFRGWEYNGKKIFDSKGNKIENVDIAETMTFKAIFAQDVILTITTNMIDAGTISGEGTYQYNSNVDVSVTTNRGYVFVGWYLDNTLLSNQETYNYTIENVDITLEARFRYNVYELKVESAYPILGSVMITGDSEYKESSTKEFNYLSDVTVSAKTNTTDYQFLGWFDEENNLVESNAEYSFKMPYENYHLIAKWEAPSFDVNLTKNYANGGTVNGAGSYEYNSNVLISVELNDGYSFDGFYIDNSRVCEENEYSFKMPYKDVDIETRFNLITYTISYDLVGGTNNINNPTDYTVEDNKTLYDPTKTGYTFNGWYNGSTKIESITKGMYGNLTLTAHWAANSYTVTAISSDTSKGTVTGSGSYDYGSEVTLKATPISDCVFKGWFSDASLKNKVSVESNYKFTLLNEGLTLYGKFLTKAEDEQEQWDINHGVTPTFNESKGTITYGLYPQTHVSDDSLIASLNALDSSAIDSRNNWYLYNKEYYAKTTAITYESGYKFDDGTTITEGTTYWFKCEPIEWKILSNNNDEYFLLSSVLLDVSRYDDSSNNYEDSEIRSWLNGDFYNSAFALSTNAIKPSSLTNNDNISLLTYGDYLNESYGFSPINRSHESRECKTTDWLRAKGGYSSTMVFYPNNGCYWTRSPDPDYPGFTWGINHDGSPDKLVVGDGNKSCGVRPCLNIG